MRCESCRHPSNTYEAFLDLSLEINKADSVCPPPTGPAPRAGAAGPNGVPLAPGPAAPEVARAGGARFVAVGRTGRAIGPVPS